jgi:hypothetical protein
VNAAIVVVLVLMALGIVGGSLLRLRDYLNKSAPAQEFQPPLDDEDE